ncbi:hypothetical protein SEUCBS140593_009129 [Sporothrix eucalyptigena]|uniref:Ankyrin repeat protein n=1 Tax=Sporothrix eucalyptigena TaxID=1812306 RepID=A0ABP0CTQ7_9PEZI
MIFASECGHVRILKALLDCRDTLTPEHHDPVRENYERYGWLEGDNITRFWDMLLTTACMCAQVEVVQLLLERMLEPMQAVARYSHRITLSSNDDFGPAQTALVAEESERRAAMDHSADTKAPNKSFERLGQTYNLQPLCHHPSGIGNVLVQDLAQPRGSDVGPVRMLIDKVGINVHEGYFLATSTFDGRGQSGVSDGVDDEGKRLDMMPSMIDSRPSTRLTLMPPTLHTVPTLTTITKKKTGGLGPRTETEETENKPGVARRLKLISKTDQDGNTALHWVKAYGPPHAQAELLALRSRPDARNFGEVPTQGSLLATTRLSKYRRLLD